MKSKVVSLMFSLLFCVDLFSQDIWSALPNLIAHGGGSIDGYIYTNSKEAVKLSLDKGFQFIELDISFTSDGQMVMVHDWELFNSSSGYPEKGDSVPTLNEFRSRKIYGRYTPLTISDVVELMQWNENWFFVSDKFDDAVLLDSILGAFKSRMLVEAFDMEAYLALKRVGFIPMFSAGEKESRESFLQKSVEAMMQGDSPIEFVSVYCGGDFGDIEQLKCLHPFHVAAYTSNDEEFVNAHLGNEFDLIYTDYLVP